MLIKNTDFDLFESCGGVHIGIDFYSDSKRSMLSFLATHCPYGLVLFVPLEPYFFGAGLRKSLVICTKYPIPVICTKHFYSSIYISIFFSFFKILFRVQSAESPTNENFLNYGKHCSCEFALYDRHQKI